MLTFPHMGNLHIPLSAIFKELQVETLVPPYTTEKTLDLGQLYGPEFSCLPLKILLGNTIESIERGAKTLVMLGGVGPCRLGLFSMAQEIILQDLGYDFTMVALEPSMKSLFLSLREILPSLSLIDLGEALFWGYRKLKAVEYIEERVNRARPYLKGISSILEKYLEEVDRASTEEELQQILKEVSDLPEGLAPKIGIIGDIFTILDSFSNMDLNRHLGELGVVPYPSVTISSWIREHLFLRPLGLLFYNRVERAASPYLKHSVGGLGLEGIGHAVLYAREGFLGAIQVFPLTCMPETVAEGILQRVSRDYGFPIMSIIYDEERSPVGLCTRLEAFVDLVTKRRGDGLGEGFISRGGSWRYQDHDSSLRQKGEDTSKGESTNRCSVWRETCSREDRGEH